MISKKVRDFLIFALIVIVGAALFFWSDFKMIYSRLTLDLPQVEEGLNNLIEEAERQILNPPPLTSEKEAQKGALTREGVIEATNAERAKLGLPALKESLSLDVSAAAKVEDMINSQYFAHDSPSGVGVKDLAESVGYDFIVIGENLALGNFENDQDLVNAWMNSPGHRENILNKNYQEIGVSVEKGIFQGRTTWLAVQHFGRPLTACPQPSLGLKVNIEVNKTELSEIQNSLNIVQMELQQLRRRDDAFSQKIQEYNSLVSQYNDLVSQTRAMVDEYNIQIRAFNECAVSSG